MTLKELDVLMQKIRGTSVLSLEEFLPNERGYEIPLLDTLRDDGTEVTSAVEAREIKAALVRAVDELPPARADRHLAVLLRRPHAQGDQGRAQRLGVARLADPRASRDPPAHQAARAARRSGIS